MAVVLFRADRKRADTVNSGTMRWFALGLAGAALLLGIVTLLDLAPAI
ncbi:hypothetical protein [Aurantiacibacter spongiae]|nr:hypothetical protein [Aurantiacibacter spongiae]